eukprot:g3203.t1
MHCLLSFLDSKDGVPLSDTTSLPLSPAKLYLSGPTVAVRAVVSALRRKLKVKSLSARGPSKSSTGSASARNSRGGGPRQSLRTVVAFPAELCRDEGGLGFSATKRPAGPRCDRAATALRPRGLRPRMGAVFGAEGRRDLEAQLRRVEASERQRFVREQQLLAELDARTRTPHLLVQIRSLGVVEICGKNHGGIFERLGDWLKATWGLVEHTSDLRPDVYVPCNPLKSAKLRLQVRPVQPWGRST